MPVATVGAILTQTIDDTEHILLTKRNVEPFKGRWCMPGGHIEAYETALDAVKREVREETGLEFDPVFFGHCEEILPEVNFHAIVLFFTGTPSGTAVADPKEVAEIRWFPLRECLTMPLAFIHNDVLRSYGNASRPR